MIASIRSSHGKLECEDVPPPNLKNTMNKSRTRDNERLKIETVENEELGDEAKSRKDGKGCPRGA